VRLSQLGTSATLFLLYQSRIIDDECGAVGGMRIGKGNRSIRRKPAPVPFCLPEIPNALSWDRTRAAAVENRRLTAWAMAWPTRNIFGDPFLSFTCSLGRNRAAKMNCGNLFTFVCVKGHKSFCNYVSLQTYESCERVWPRARNLKDEMHRRPCVRPRCLGLVTWVRKLCKHISSL
jgi:hypothetical protein